MLTIFALRYLIILAGLPTAIALSGTSLVTTLPAPTMVNQQ